MVKKTHRPTRLSVSRRIRLKMFNRVYLGNHARSGWREELPFYAFECQEHRTVINYPQGYERRLAYPLCDKEPIPQMG